MKNNSKEAKNKKRSDLTVWIICLLASFVVWLYVMSVESPLYEKSFSSVPITIKNSEVLAQEKSLSVISDGNMTVDLTVSGSKKDFGDFGVEDLDVSIDVSGIEDTGKHTLDIKVSLPSGMVIKSIVPSSVTLHVDNRISRPIPVRTSISSSLVLAKDCKLGEIAPEVTSITVEGPESILSGISHAQLDIDLGKLDHSVTKTATVRLLDANGIEVSQNSLTLSHTEIEVDIPVYTEKTVAVKVDTVYGMLNDENSLFEIVPSEISVKGDPYVLANINSILLMTVNEKELSGNFKKTVKLELPNGVVCTDGTEEVAVSITHVGTATDKITASNIKITSNPKNLSYTIDTKSCELTLRGNANLLSALKAQPDMISVGVSLYGIDKSGTYSLPAEITLLSSEYKSIYEIGEYFVTVTVNK
jgi:YbbR domain-containing protein